MNIIKTIYDKVKRSYDDFWAEYEEAMEVLPIEERMALYNRIYT